MFLNHVPKAGKVGFLEEGKPGKIAKGHKKSNRTAPDLDALIFIKSISENLEHLENMKRKLNKTCQSVYHDNLVGTSEIIRKIDVTDCPKDASHWSMETVSCYRVDDMNINKSHTASKVVATFF